MEKHITLLCLFLLSVSLKYSYGQEQTQNEIEDNLLNMTPKQTALKWIDAYNSHNADTAASLYDEKVTNTQFPYAKAAQGREAMRKTYENIFRAFPDIHIEAINIVEQGTWVVVEWTFSGTMQGEFAGHSPNGNKFNMSGCEIFQIVNGRILTQHGYWDKNTMFGQLKLNSN